MESIYLILLLLYATIPPASLFFTLKLIYQANDKYGWHYHYFLKYLISFSFLPLLLLPAINLGLQPKNILSVIFLVITFILAIAGIKPAKKRKVVFLYFGGVYAAFMEEILYRGIIFGLVNAIWGNIWIALTISSLAFGVWHLKNFPWHEDRKTTLIQFFYTAFVYGPIFALLRIWTGDIYLAILFHYITDATVALAPNWMRGWLVFGGTRKNDFDTYNNK